MTSLSTKEQYLQKYIEAVIARTPSDIINEDGFDLTIGAPIRAMGEGVCTVAAISQDTTEEECKRQSRETMFLLSSVEPIAESKASGKMNITSTQSRSILAGDPVYSTVTGNKVAEVLETVEFTGAETKDINIIADVAGADISFAIGTLFLILDYQSGSNLTIINNGTDEETEYARTLRVMNALKAKAHGTPPALLNAAGEVTIKDENGAIIESVKNIFMSYPWKHEDPETLDPDRLGEIVMYIQSSIGVPSAGMIVAIRTALTGDDELEGKQGAGQNVDLRPVETKDISFTVPYKKLIGGVHETITTAIQSAITTYVTGLNQGVPINPTNWQSAIESVENVEYYDEANLLPATLQEIEAYKIWNITSITVTEI